MAENLRFVTRNCLEWITDCPFLHYSKQSPIFSFSNIDCYLSLHIKIDAKSYVFYLYLHKAEMEEKHLKEKIRITFYVTRDDLSGYNIVFMKSHIDIDLQCNKYIAVSKNIGSSKESLHSYYGRLTVLCFFSTDLPSELCINRSEAMCLSTLPGLERQPSSTPDSIIMKAKLAASANDDSPSSLKNLSFDFSRLLEQKTFSDVTLKCGNRTFSAHRNILAARSEVFAAMFQTKMIESQTGSVDIKDIDGDVLDLLLKYLYSGKLSDISVGVASKLYMAADKYSVSSLKKECSKWMLGSLTKENCLDFLLLADACSDNSFKDRLINFIAEILTFLGEAWLKFTEKNPQLAVVVYQRYALITKKV